MKELEIKLAHIRALLDQHQLDALLQQRVGSFEWASCGAPPNVNTASTRGRLLYLPPAQARFSPIPNNIESICR